MTLLVLYVLLSTALWYLGSRALITQPLWSRYSPRFARFMDCPACTGFWWGVFFAIVIGYREGLAFFELAPDNWITPIVVGLCMITAVPIVAGVLTWCLWQAGSATDIDE